MLFEVCGFSNIDYAHDLLLWRHLLKTKLSFQYIKLSWYLIYNLLYSSIFLHKTKTSISIQTVLKQVFRTHAHLNFLISAYGTL